MALNLVPGLVQTPEYARNIIAQGSAPADQVELLVRSRMSRQSVLSQQHAPDVRLIVDEGVLHRQVGGPMVMREQIDQLLRS